MILLFLYFHFKYKPAVILFRDQRSKNRVTQLALFTGAALTGQQFIGNFVYGDLL